MSAIIELTSLKAEEELKRIEDYQEGEGNREWLIIGRTGNYASIMANKKEYGNKKKITVNLLEDDLIKYLAKALEAKPEEVRPKIKLSYLYIPANVDILLSEFARKTV